MRLRHSRAPLVCRIHTFHDAPVENGQGAADRLAAGTIGQTQPTGQIPFQRGKRPSRASLWRCVPALGSKSRVGGHSLIAC